MSQYVLSIDLNICHDQSYNNPFAIFSNIGVFFDYTYHIFDNLQIVAMWNHVIITENYKANTSPTYK